MDCDSIGSIENNVFVPLTLHALSMGAIMVARTLKDITNHIHDWYTDCVHQNYTIYCIFDATIRYR